MLRDIYNNQWIPILNTLTKPYLESKALNQVLKSLKKFDSYAGKSGSIDLWSITDDGEDIFVWEVKPGSFEKYPKRIKGIEQIYRYVNLPKIKVGTNLAKNDVEFYFGNDIMLECPTGNFEFSIENFTFSGFCLKNISLDLHNSSFEGNIETEYEHRFASLGQPIYRLEAYLKEENND